MGISQEKRKRLAYVARRYYLEDQKQSDIAKELGVSRPMVSRLLAEARELGIVEIKIHDPETRTANLLDRLCRTSSIHGGVLVEDEGDNDATNRLLSQGAVQLLRQLGARRLGVGWGYLIGQIVTWLEENPQTDSSVTDICPLVGNASIPARNYQSNENIRLMAQQLGATPHFLYLPALPESLEEKEILCSTEVYRQIAQQWDGLDTALVNIGDYPSSPDFASLVRYGSLLQQRHGGLPPIFQLAAHPCRYHRVFLVQFLHLPQVQRGVFRRHGYDDCPQLFLQSTAARQNFLLAAVDVRKGMVHHVQQKRLLGGVNGVDGLFADMQRLCHLLHGEMQPLLTEQLHGLRAHQRIELFLHERPPCGNCACFSGFHSSAETELNQAVSAFSAFC